MKQNLKLLLLSDKWNIVSHDAITCNLVRGKELLTRSRKKNSAAAFCSLWLYIGRTAVADKVHKALLKQFPSQGVSSELPFQGYMKLLTILVFSHLATIVLFIVDMRFSCFHWFFLYVSASVFWWVNKLKKIMGNLLCHVHPICTSWLVGLLPLTCHHWQWWLSQNSQVLLTA